MWRLLAQGAVLVAVAAIAYTLYWCAGFMVTAVRRRRLSKMDRWPRLGKY